MWKLVTIDLSSADTSAFESYESEVISLLSKYGARMEVGVRSVDGSTETHLLYFSDIASFQLFLADPTRVSMQDQWNRIGAKSTIVDVDLVDYIDESVP